MKQVSAYLNEDEYTQLCEILEEGQSVYSFVKSAVIHKLAKIRGRDRDISKGREGEGIPENENHSLMDFEGADINEKKKRLSRKKRS